MIQKYIKCAFCSWKTKAWVTKKGKRKNGYYRLLNHIMIEHEIELNNVYDRIYMFDEEGRINESYSNRW